MSLVLTRKVGQKLILIIQPSDHEQRVEINVNEIYGNHDLKARLGIEAPREIQVHRLEVFERIQAEQLPPTFGEQDVNSHRY